MIIIIPILLMSKLRLKRIKNLPKVTQRVQVRVKTQIEFIGQSLCLTIRLYISGSQRLIAHLSPYSRTFYNV